MYEWGRGAIYNHNVDEIIAQDSKHWFEKGGSDSDWFESTRYGFYGHMFYTHSNKTSVDNWGRWSHEILTDGKYKIYVFVPPNYASSTSAKYQVFSNGIPIMKIAVNQDINRGRWVWLGNYDFKAGDRIQVFLDDNTEEKNRLVAYDTVKILAKQDLILPRDGSGREPKCYFLELYEDDIPSDRVINLGEDITAKATTNHSSVVNVTFRWIDPSNNEVRNTTVPIVNGEASDAYTPNQVGTWKVVAEFSNKLQVPSKVVVIGREETLEFNNTEGFINKLSNILTNEGLSSEQINAIISKIDTSQIPSQGIIKLQLKHGSIYGLGVIMPHDPPLNINENIQVIVLYASLGSPININDLHVKAISPTNNEDILLEENWYPNTIDDPFVWISPAIVVNEAGEWHIVTDFTTNDGNTSTVVLTIQTRFGVVPESIIGALSIIGSSLAVLAVYRRRRKVNNN
jgi:hypothetical protein